MTPTQRKAMEQAALAIFPAMPYGRIGTKDIQQQALQLAYAGLIAALAEPAPVPLLTDDEIAGAGKLDVEGDRMLPYSFARAIEALVRQKAGL